MPRFEKGSEAARQAALRSAEVRREKREAQRELARRIAEGDAEGMYGGAPQGVMGRMGVGSSATDAVDLAVVRELERKAQAGDIAAAKELREWRRRDPAQDADADALAIASIVVRLTRPQRNELREVLLRLLASQETAANGGFREGSFDGFDSLPIGDVAATTARGDATPANDEPLRARGAGRRSELLETSSLPASNGNEPLPADGTDDHPAPEAW